ncbi:MAG TPA: phosphotransferase [Anaeromyxobacteraceae bacterium]|nr:phosphotransferase [Anaeromyxobacteraceae bacterium]
MAGASAHAWAGAAKLPPGLDEALAHLFPGARVLGCDPLGADEGGAATEKARGYGVPLRICIRTALGESRCLVLRTALADEFGHDRRSDRAAEMLLAYDTFESIAGHVRVLDVGAIAADGLRSLRGAGEFYLLTTYVDGEPYANDLRRIARDGRVSDLDLQRLDELVRWLVGIHAERLDEPVAWRRAIRDVVGSGEGIFGIVDGYPPDTPGAPATTIHAIEQLAVDWRVRLRERTDRLRRIHGDFHPFNILFDEGTRFTPVDASRGSKGDPADDLTALAVNFPFFALEHPAGWRDGTGVLWRELWRGYVARTGDSEVLELAAPYLAWRALVVACPRFYPRLGADSRAKMLELARRSLEQGFTPELAEDLFR